MKEMKTLKQILGIFFIVALVNGCAQDDDLDYVEAIPAPTNVAALVTVTPDNTGLVTITPTAEGAATFSVAFGDGSGESSDLLRPGESTQNNYEEGSYTIEITATGINGKVTTIPQEIVVSYEPPQNLEVIIENDGAVSKRVNVEASADFALSYEVDFGVDGVDPIAANIDEAVSYDYEEPGIYTITVTAFSAAIETTSYTVDFEVTEITQPIDAAPSPQARNGDDVISMFSNAYETDVNVSSWRADWSTSILTDIQINGNDTKFYADADFVGVEFYGADAVDASEMEYFHVDVWTPDATTFRVKLVDLGGVATEAEIVFDDIVQGEWVSLNIPMSEFTDGGMTAVNSIQQLIFSGLPAGTFDFFIDNVYFYKAPSNNSTLMIEDFEGTPPVFTVFGNIADTEVVINPDMSGENTTANVAQLTKTSGSQTWAGTFFETTSPIDLDTYSKINVKTWSPVSGAVVKLKLENSDASITYEVDLNTTVSSQWENLLYDFSEAPVANYMRIVIFFDFGNAGNDAVYYFDEIESVNNSGGPAPLTFQDFEGTLPTFTVFGNIADTEVIPNPDISGLNTTSNVAQLTKTGGSETWAGTFFETATILDLNTYSSIRVKTWSPNNGVVVKLKLENADASITHEVDLNTTVANAWEELTYDFSEAPAADYMRVVIFFDFGNNGDDSVYYFDEFQLTN